MTTSAHEAVEEVVRTSYGRLVALLVSRGGDMAAAEDALSDALVAALRTWPERGIPASPEAWMLTAARRSLIGAHRRRATAERAAGTVTLLAEELRDRAGSAFPDRRLELLFACAHPALAPEVRAPLMVQVVLGLDAARIAAAFQVKPATMGQQLVRAKQRIATAGIPYRIPPAGELSERLGAVLDAIYVTYGVGWDDPAGADPRSTDLTGEAIHLAGAVVELLPREAEAHGLLALLLHSEARAGARRDADGRFVALSDQDPSLWSRDAMARAEVHLATAVTLGVVGPYQLQAAIQSVHNRRAVTGATDWTAVALLHDGLHALAPSLGGDVARAAAHLHASGPAAARRALADLDPPAVDGYQPYWATVAAVAAAEGDARTAAGAWERAIALTDDVEVAAHLRVRRSVLGDVHPSGATGP